jgi:hypothetical protein
MAENPNYLLLLPAYGRRSKLSSSVLPEYGRNPNYLELLQGYGRKPQNILRVRKYKGKYKLSCHD